MLLYTPRVRGGGETLRSLIKESRAGPDPRELDSEACDKTPTLIAFARLKCNTRFIHMMGKGERHLQIQPPSWAMLHLPTGSAEVPEEVVIVLHRERNPERISDEASGHFLYHHGFGTSGNISLTKLMVLWGVKHFDYKKGWQKWQISKLQINIQPWVISMTLNNSTELSHGFEYISPCLLLRTVL